MDKNKYCWRPGETCSPIRCPVLLVAVWAKNITSIVRNFVIPTAHGSRMCRGEVQRTWKVHSGVCVFYIFKVTPDTGSPPFGFDQKVWLFPDLSFSSSGSRSQILTITLIQLFCNSDSTFWYPCPQSINTSPQFSCAFLKLLPTKLSRRAAAGWDPYQPSPTSHWCPVLLPAAPGGADTDCGPWWRTQGKADLLHFPRICSGQDINQA